MSNLALESFEIAIKFFGKGGPEEKYLHDPQYAQLVNVLSGMIHQYQFTPSEIREAAIFACTKYEMERSELRFIIKKAPRSDETGGE